MEKQYQSFRITYFRLLVILLLVAPLITNANKISLKYENKNPLLEIPQHQKGHMTKIDETYELLVDNVVSDIKFKNKNNDNIDLSKIDNNRHITLSGIHAARKNLHINNKGKGSDQFNSNKKVQQKIYKDSTKKQGKKKKITDDVNLLLNSSQRKWKFFEDKSQNNNKLCDAVLCDWDEYCFVAELGVAECLKNPMVNQQQQSSQTINNSEEVKSSINFENSLLRSQALIKSNNKKNSNVPAQSNSGSSTKSRENENEDDYDNLMDDFGQYIDYDDLDDDDDLYDDEDHHHHHQYHHHSTIINEKINSKQNHHISRKYVDKFKPMRQEVPESSKLYGRTNMNNNNNRNHQKINGLNKYNIESIRSFNQIKNHYHNEREEKSKIIQCLSCPFTHGQVICGTDNSTYSSMCRIEFHNCIHGTNVKFACFGFCPCTKVFIQDISNILEQKNRFPNEYSYQMSLKPNLSKSQYHSEFNEKNTEITLKNYSQDFVLTKDALSKHHYFVDQTDSDSQKLTNSSIRNDYRKNKQSCSSEELRSMGFRLLDWFTVVMKEELKRKSNKKFSLMNETIPYNYIQRKSLPDCEEQVSFMFYHFDIDHNYKLSPEELYYLEHDENEHCLEPYLVQCDEDVNNLLSAYEWCTCFSLRSKPCLYQQKHIAKNGLVGQHVPQCDEKGHYRNVQCHSSRNYCWCSDKNGNEIAGTRVRGRLPICDKSYPLNMNRFKKMNTNTNTNNINNNKHKPIVEKNYKKITNRENKIINNGKTSSPSYVDINEDMEDGDDDDGGGDDDENVSFNLDRGSGFDSF